MGNSARTPYPYPYLSSDEFGCTAGLEPATSSCQAGALLSSFFFFRVWCGGDRTRDLVSRLAKLLLALSDEKSSANRRSANMCSKIAVCMTSVFVLVVRCASSLHVHTDHHISPHQACTLLPVLLSTRNINIPQESLA